MFVFHTPVSLTPIPAIAARRTLIPVRFGLSRWLGVLGVLVVLAVPAAALAQGETQDRRAQTADDSPEEGELMSTEPVGGDLPVSTPQAQQRDIPRALGGQASSGGPDGHNAANTDPSSLAPYGSQLFSDRTPVDREISVNPEYAIKPGDRVAVRMWGALSFDQVLSVDQQGNIFLPEIGPIELAGVPNGELDSVVRSAVRRVYTEDVGVYTNLLGTQPIGVYVTGAVNAPGHYPGSRGDTLLYYLARAGGIDPARGSYRRIEIKRDGEVIAEADLYNFLSDGEMPSIDFRSADSIVVKQRRNTFTVAGRVQNAYRFEMPGETISGSGVIELTSPEADASYALVEGVRNGSDFATYLPIREFRNFTVRSGDHIVFNSDTPQRKILVSVIGNSGGPSSFTLPKGATLGTFANLIQVDPEVARLEAKYLRRDSVAERQKQAIERALYRLQKQVLTAPSVSRTESQIRTSEAELVQQFVQRAQSLEPEGRVVLANAENWRDVRLEDGDELVIPNQSDVVLISGEVEVPQTVIYNEDFSVQDYVDEAGGTTERGDGGGVLVVQANGRVHEGGRPIQPGDHVMVLPGGSQKTFAITQDVVETVFRTALSTATVLNASRN